MSKTTFSIFLFIFNLIYVLTNTDIDIFNDIVVKDFGEEGTNKSVSLTFKNGLNFGSVIIIASKTGRRGTIDICDKFYNNLIQIDTRIYSDKLTLNSYINKRWLPYSINIKSPVERNEATITTILYQEEGYRIYFNGNPIAFYEHQSNNDVHHLLAFHNRIFKIVYIDAKFINFTSED